MDTFRFFNFQVYLKAKDFYKEILVVSEYLKDYPLKDQIRRAALSIILNIAEGSAKESDKDFARFLQNSLGSINEVAACLDLMRDLSLIDLNKFESLLKDAEEIAKQLGGFYKKLHN